ncbi:hypothetical protein [Caballeronia humi]|uniref:Uncharacterized protein n=1 Tax=Caballeronia humi TaxID=326474 RepID=A0A158G8A5_9BURK|nr:hypothetical protein [Caballeronia humi]SAL28262.1 hypothetical protein AWB65_01671 [Caballeronia humi]
MTEQDKPRIVRVSVPRAAIDEIRQSGHHVVTFSGYSNAGYEDQGALEQCLSDLLAGFDPVTTKVCAGATAAGIGAVYPIASERGFETIGVVSSMAEREKAAFSTAVGTVFIVTDESWGGYVGNTRMLSLTSLVMVEVSDELICIGGGSIARDEYEVAERMGKIVRFMGADMNHAAALEKTQRKGTPPPSDFKGPLYEFLNKR